MALTYLVLAHQHPGLLGELARLTDPHRLLVHVDAKYDSAPFRAAAPRADFIAHQHRIDVRWGHWSVVEATLALMRSAEIASDDYATLVSGDSAPIRTNTTIDRFLDDHGGSQFMDALPLHDDDEALRRLQRVHLERYPESGWRMRMVNGSRRALDHRQLGRREPRWGSMWWTLTGAAVDWTLRTLEDDRSLRHFYRFSHVPDEGLLQTLMASSPFAEQLRPSLMYADIPHGDAHARAVDGRDWTADEVERPFGTGSVTITAPALWARKFTTPDAMRSAQPI